VAGDDGLVDQLAQAAAQGDGAAVAQLLAAGADPNILVSARGPVGEVRQTTALCAAAALGRLQAVRLLLAGGADPSRATSDGGTPLMAAAGGGQLEALQLLLGGGAAVDTTDPTTGSTAFHMACYSNHAECAEVLARAGCDVGIKDKKEMTGREVAEGKGHAVVVARLRAVVGEQLRAAQAAVVGDGKPAAQLVTAAGEGDVAAVSRLLAAGADPNASVAVRTPSGEVVQDTALCVAAQLGRLEVARLLLEGGADPGRADGDGTTPLMVAAGIGHLEVLRLLLGRGAAVDVAHPGTGRTAFHNTCYSNQVECAEVLVRAGCDVGIKDKMEKTGREVAEATGRKEVARRLRAIARQPFVGVLVELAGLVGAAEHNGKRATVMSTRPSHDHASVFLTRVHLVCTLHKHRRTLCAAVGW
jgi:ankyrin repeat protein